MIKPDGVQRGLVGRIIARFEDRGLKLVGLKMLLADEDLLMEHYAELRVGRRCTWSLYLKKVSLSSAKFHPGIGGMASLS
jgi:nucleoside diphosphate kinase